MPALVISGLEDIQIVSRKKIYIFGYIHGLCVVHCVYVFGIHSLVFLLYISYVFVYDVYGYSRFLAEGASQPVAADCGRVLPLALPWIRFQPSVGLHRFHTCIDFFNLASIYMFSLLSISIEVR